MSGIETAAVERRNVEVNIRTTETIKRTSYVLDPMVGNPAFIVDDGSIPGKYYNELQSALTERFAVC